MYGHFFSSLDMVLLLVKMLVDLLGTVYSLPMGLKEQTTICYLFSIGALPARQLP